MDTLADRPALALPAEPMTPHPYRVTAVQPLGPQVAGLKLRPLGEALALPAPGTFMMVWVLGIGEIPVSVSGASPDGTVELIVRAVGATSTAIVASAAGDVIGLRGPFGTAWPVAEAEDRHVVVMAGGLGVAPLRMAIQALLWDRPRPASVTVLIGARLPDQVLLPDEHHAWRSAGARVVTTVDTADRGWTGAVGTVTELLTSHHVTGDLAFVCGPEPMMLSAAHGLLDAGFDPSAIHVSLERNMHCGIAKCGRCQLGELVLCRDGAVTRWDAVADLVTVRGR